MITAEVNQKYVPISSRLSQSLVQSLLDEVARRTKQEGHLSVAFVSAMTIRRLNRRYRGKDAVTDVLAFEAPLCEVLICYEQAKRQARQAKRTVRQEVMDLLIHGVLHVFGYDHERSKDARIMLPLQKKIYDKFSSD